MTLNKIFFTPVLFLIFTLAFTEVNAQKTIFEQFNFDKRIRKWIVHLPPDYDSTKLYPLYVNMHGFTSNANQQMQYSEFNNLSDSKSCIVVYPDGINSRWNAGDVFGVSSNVDDVGFISRLIDRMILIYHADPNKIYSTGFSNGGFMSHRLACERTNRFAAVAPVAGSMNNDIYESCTPARRISIVSFNGDDDALTQFDGISGYFPDIMVLMKFWAQINGCNKNPQSTQLENKTYTDKCNVVKYDFLNCQDDVQEILFKIDSGGHTWPGSSTPGVGNTNQDISANEEIWKFCSQFSIPESVRGEAPQNLSAMVSSGPANSYHFSWDESSGVQFYTFALIDEQGMILFTDSLMSNSITAEVLLPDKYKWSVATNYYNGYVAWADVKVVESLPTGISSRETIRLELYPNPVQDVITLKHVNTNVSKILNIYDLQGENYNCPVISTSNELKLDVSQLSSGVYFISWGDAKGKFIKLP